MSKYLRLKINKELSCCWLNLQILLKGNIIYRLALFKDVIKVVSTQSCAGLFSLAVFILNDLRITNLEMQFFRYYFEYNFA
jgi:hypothetical protein